MFFSSLTKKHTHSLTVTDQPFSFPFARPSVGELRLDGPDQARPEGRWGANEFYRFTHRWDKFVFAASTLARYMCNLEPARFRLYELSRVAAAKPEPFGTVNHPTQSQARLV